MELWDPDCGRRAEGLAVVFLRSLSDSLSKHTTSYKVSALFFHSFCFILTTKERIDYVANFFVLIITFDFVLNVRINGVFLNSTSNVNFIK